MKMKQIHLDQLSEEWNAVMEKMRSQARKRCARPGIEDAIGAATIMICAAIRESGFDAIVPGPVQTVGGVNRK